MNKPKVLNKYTDTIPNDAVYIGRPSEWGNPFKIDAHTNRTQAIEEYRKWLCSKPHLIAKAKQVLKGKDLVCFCAPKPCHGDILLEIANND